MKSINSNYKREGWGKYKIYLAIEYICGIENIRFTLL